ncbi:MAG: plastocyanin/azurin family copper-binding protein [Polyangiaceae bacterium]
MRNRILLVTLLGASMALATGCDDGGGGTGGTGGTGGNGGGGTGGTTNPTGGTGGTGGATTNATAGTGGTGGSTGGTGGTGGSTMTGAMLNGCDSTTAEDHTADATTTVASSGLSYSPKCIKIKAGSSVKFSSSFASHPLVGGEFVNGAKQPDANSPIPSTNMGTEITVTFPDAGDFGYYCDFHAGSGMVGAVFVE